MIKQCNNTAFADEFGNNSFDFEKQGSHFIVATVICKSEYLDELSKEIQLIRKKHNFQESEIKSSKVGPNFNRRLKILQDIVKLNISIYAVIIDKRKLHGKGFEYKKSFYKFLNNLLYKELFRTFPKLDLYVDEFGSNDYMLEFKKYIEKQHPKTLFSGYEFNILNSKQSDFIQIADFIAGSLGYIFDETKKSEHSPRFEELLKPITSSLNIFPREFSFKEIQEANIDETFNEKIAEVCFLRIQDFLDKHSGIDQQKIDQINFLKLMLLFLRVNVRNKYITTKEIFVHLNQNREVNLTEEYFRTKIIGNLRDKGVLISSSRNGYKIPTCLNDLENFIRQGHGIIIPMLNRIREARNVIKLATGNDLDLLTKGEFLELKKLLDK